MGLEMKHIIEGLLFVSETPMTAQQLAKAMDVEDLNPIREVLKNLLAEYQSMDRAFSLVEVAGGYAFRTKPELATWLRKSRRAPESRLSPAALETVAIVAYKQPVLKAEIERLRGVAVDGVLRMLMEKDLIRVAGRKDLPGRPLIYGTTKRFLEIFGLKDLRDLPTLEEMEALMGELEPVVPKEDLDKNSIFKVDYKEEVLKHKENPTLFDSEQALTSQEAAREVEPDKTIESD